jgi:hypothetical protein
MVFFGLLLITVPAMLFVWFTMLLVLDLQTQVTLQAKPKKVDRTRERGKTGKRLPRDFVHSDWLVKQQSLILTFLRMTILPYIKVLMEDSTRLLVDALHPASWVFEYGLLNVKLIFAIFLLVRGIVETPGMISSVCTLTLSAACVSSTLVSFLWSLRFFVFLPTYLTVMVSSLYVILFFAVPKNFMICLNAVMVLGHRVYFTVFLSLYLTVSTLVQLTQRGSTLQIYFMIASIVSSNQDSTERFFVMTLGLYYVLTVVWVIITFKLVHPVLSIHSLLRFLLVTLGLVLHLCDHFATWTIILSSWVTYTVKNLQFNHGNMHRNHGGLLILLRMFSVVPAVCYMFDPLDNTDHPPPSPANLAFQTQQALSISLYSASVLATCNEIRQLRETRFNHNTPSKVGQGSTEGHSSVSPVVVSIPFPVLLYTTLERLSSLQSTSETLLNLTTLTSEQTHILQTLQHFLNNEIHVFQAVYQDTHSPHSPSILGTAKRQSVLLVQFSQHDVPSWVHVSTLTFCNLTNLKLRVADYVKNQAKVTITSKVNVQHNQHTTRKQKNI